ncbi:MAG: hypothetical protein WDZ72_07860 [Cyclobacteriaceae bacterium]
MDKAKILLFLTFSFFYIRSGFTQEIEVEGYFQQDSALLGERVAYVLKAKYPSSLPVLFPDSTFRFGSMEFLGKQTFASSTDEGMTLDSAVYYLSNFSLDSIKNYRLPVFEILRYDSISHYPQEAKLKLRLTIDEIPETLTFQETNSYQKINPSYNYPYLLIASGFVLVLILALIYFFGKNIKNKWYIHKEKKRWKRFLVNWETSKQSFLDNPSMDQADELLGLWKGYLENLTGNPYKEWTSTEISLYLNNPEILKDFRKIELIIYANRYADDMNLACDNLLNISRSLLDDKIKKIQDHE